MNLLQVTERSEEGAAIDRDGRVFIYSRATVKASSGMIRGESFAQPPNGEAQPPADE
jgi:hypothetical protein